MMTISLLLYIVAFVLIVLGAIGVPARISLAWAGMALWLFTQHLLTALPG